jgi:hypothetical protein
MLRSVTFSENDKYNQIIRKIYSARDARAWNMTRHIFQP